jgi:hypothetical protein
LFYDRIPVSLRGPVRVRSSRTGRVGGPPTASGPAVVIDGEVAGEPAGPAAVPLPVESRRLD